MEGEWSLFYEMYSEEADFMAELLSNCTLPRGVDDETPMIYSSDGTHDNTSRGNGNILLPMSSTSDQSESSQIFGANSSLMSIDYCVVEGKDDGFQVQAMVNDGMYGDEFLNEGIMSSNGIESKSLKLGKETRLALEDGRGNNWSEMSNKRPRIGGEVQKNKRAMKKKGMSNSDSDNDNNNVVLHRQSSSSCYSEEESNASHELNGGVSSNSKGSAKTQSSRGSATDPQSLYARKRRERINERLRILQNLVPNGTKVDISTMLEEAVQYVNFLQLQIKLLSSDDLWMHAPIAYNGKDIGLDLKIDSIPKSSSGNSRHKHTQTL